MVIRVGRSSTVAARKVPRISPAASALRLFTQRCPERGCGATITASRTSCGRELWPGVYGVLIERWTSPDAPAFVGPAGDGRCTSTARAILRRAAKSLLHGIVPRRAAIEAAVPRRASFDRRAAEAREGGAAQGVNSRLALRPSLFYRLCRPYCARCKS